MTHLKPARPSGNAMLAGVKDPSFQQFLGSLKPLELDAAMIIARADEPCAAVFFPVTGVLSVMSVIDDARVGTAIVGNEGFAPLAPFHGAERTPEQIEVHVSGLFLRVSIPLFQQAISAFPELRDRMHRFSQYMFSTVSRGSGCDRRHGVKERCARLLLSTHDRAPDDEFSLTHERLATNLGVRRASISVAAEELRRAGAIDYRRGRIRGVSRAALMDDCCGCYEALRATGDSLLGAARPA